MAGCEDGCGAKAVEAANTPEYVRVLWLVVAMNAAMFLVGVVVTATGGSVSVRSDLLDFLGDALATGIGLLLVGKAAGIRATASLWQGLALGALGLFALGSAILRVFSGDVPEPFGMGLYGILGFAVGAVRLTLTSLPSWLPRAVADWDDEATFFQTPPFPTGCDPARDLAVFSVQPQPS